MSMQHLGARALLLFLLALLAGSVFAFPAGIRQGHPSQALEVATHDVKLGKQIQLNTLLVIPDAPTPWQTVVLPSNCTGQDDHFWSLMVPALASRGYAVVLLDSFTPRGFSSVCTDKFRMWQEARVADAVAVLQALRADPRFDPARIALGGHSNGAVTAFMAAFVASAKVVKAEPLGYAAYFSVGAACDLSFKDTRLWAPLLIVSGEKDDYTFPEPCLAEARRLQAAGSDAQIHIVAGANHNMSTTGWVYNTGVMRMPKGIPRMFMRGRDEGGVMHVELEDGSLSTGRQMQEKYGGFLLSKARGGTVGGQWDKFPEVREAIFKHLERVGFTAK